MRVLIAGTDPEWAQRLEPALAAVGCAVVATLDGTAPIDAAIARHQPDVVLIHAECPRRDTLEHLAVMGVAPRPVLMLCERDDDALLRVAAQAGISLYAVETISPWVLRALLRAATEQFQLRHELAMMRRAAEERRVIDRAKCLLMERERLSEADSYHRMRRLAMRENRKLAEVALGILLRSNGDPALARALL
jgi:two-component system, response regulator / RNA-binding antiterminator